MRDFRGAKVIVRALGDALEAEAIEITHSEALELIAKAFGYENWNVLSAKTEPDEPPAEDAPSASDERACVRSRQRISRRASNTLHCSFCGKSQHEVRKLIAGRQWSSATSALMFAPTSSSRKMTWNCSG